jgi:hypothetical protein
VKTGCFFTAKGAGRVSIARFAPSNLRKDFGVYSKLAPGEWFNSVTRERYIELYRSQILSPLDPRRVHAELHAITNGVEPVLLCWERPPFNDKVFCHRRLVAEWFGDRLGIDVPELVVEPPRGGSRKPAPAIGTMSLGLNIDGNDST